MAIHVIIDTNFVYKKSLWEQPLMEPLLSIVSQLNGSIWIPLAVLEEWENHLKERIKDSYNNTIKLDKELAALRIKSAPFKVDTDQALIDLKNENTKYAKEHRIGTIPFPRKPPSLESLFSLAVTKKAPFDSKGNSFRDAIIALSIDEFATERGQDSIYLVTSDAQFSSEPRISAKNVSADKPDAIIEKLKKQLSEPKQKGLKSQQEECLKFILRSKMDDLRKAVFNTDLSRNTLLNVIGFLDFKFHPPKFVAMTETATKGKQKIPFMLSVAGPIEIATNPKTLGSFLEYQPITLKIGETLEKPSDTTQIIEDDQMVRVYGYAVYEDTELKDVVFTSTVPVYLTGGARQLARG